MEHCKRFTWNIVSVSRGTSQAFHVEHRKSFTWNIASVSRGTSQAFHVEHQRRTGCGRLRSASLLSSALIGLLAAIGFAPCPSLLWRRFLSGPLLLRIKAAPFKNPLAFAAFGRPVACLLAASLPFCGFGLRASLAVLACARCALSASSSCARLSCRHFYRHGGNAPWPPPDSRQPPADSRRQLAAARQPPADSRQPTADASLQPPDARRPTAASRQPTPAYSRPTLDARQPPADSRRQLTAARQLAAARR